MQLIYDVEDVELHLLEYYTLVINRRVREFQYVTTKLHLVILIHTT